MRRLLHLKHRKLLAGPYLFWAVSFVIIPLLMIVYYGLTDKEGHFTFSNLGMMTSQENLKALGLALLLSLISTLICLVLAYPLAMILSEKNMNQTSFIVLIFILPMWMNFLLRTLAWQTLLEKNGVINGILSFLHLPNIAIINTPWAIILGMVYNFLPFMIYPIYNTLQKMDHSLIEAAQDLGANPSQVFVKAVFPLSMPGVMSGIMMVFMPTISTFAIAELLTMNNIKLFGTTIQENINSGMWNYGAALSLIMLLLIGITGLFSNESSDSANEGGLI